jgi:hypothetical protein
MEDALSDAGDARTAGVVYSLAKDPQLASGTALRA